MFVTATREYKNSFKAAGIGRIRGGGLTFAIIFALTGLMEANRDMLEQLAGMVRYKEPVASG